MRTARGCSQPVVAVVVVVVAVVVVVVAVVVVVVACFSSYAYLKDLIVFPALVLRHAPGITIHLLIIKNLLPGQGIIF